MNRQRSCLAYIRWHMKEHKYPPSIRELAEHLDLSVSSTHELLTRLESDGLIRRTPGIPRSVTIMKARNGA